MCVYQCVLKEMGLIKNMPVGQLRGSHASEKSAPIRPVEFARKFQDKI